MIRAVKISAAATLAVMAVLATAPSADAQTEAETLLAGAKTLRCVFPLSVRTTWKGGVPVPVVRPARGNFTINIREIKADAGSAVMAAPSGPGGKDLTLVAADHNRFFLDAGGGRVALTTVVAEFTTGSKLKATHNITEYNALDLGSFKAEPEVVQYGGDCEVIP
jgi:hypothetical protein